MLKTLKIFKRTLTFKNLIFASLLTIIPLLITSLQTNAATFENYSYLGIGYNGDMPTFSATKRYVDFGVELGFAYRIYPGLNNYPCPHSDYTIINNKYQSALFGIDVLRYLDFAESCSLYGGIGLYLQTYMKVSRSNVLGWTYNQGAIAELAPAFSGGIQFHATNGSGFGIGYHSIRGVNLQFIFALQQ